MTRREAVNLIDIIRMGYICDPHECGAENARELCDIFKCDDFHEACVMAIEALEKQIPKRPKGRHTDYRCSVCGTRVRSGKGSSSRVKDTVCRKCFTVIDWSDNE